MKPSFINFFLFLLNLGRGEGGGLLMHELIKGYSDRIKVLKNIDFFSDANKYNY